MTPGQFVHEDALAIPAATAAGNDLHGIGQQSHLTSTLDGGRELMLMLGAHTRHAAGLDLAAIGDVAAQRLSVFDS